jgi:hypothetical protein
MGILDFFRKKKVEEPEIGPEEISFNELENWLENKAKSINEEEKRVLSLIKQKIDLFLEDIKEKTKVLEEVDLESKKAEERAKVIVKQGLDKYLEFANIFIKELAEIKKQNLAEFIKDANKIFSAFDKKSYIFYQRANFLIGNELLAVKEEINNLSKYFTELFNENQKIMESSTTVSSIKSKLRKIEESKENTDKINLELKSLDKKIIDINEKDERLQKEIKKIKTSKDHIENLRSHEELKLTEKQLEENISKLKSLIDFKALSQAFHSDEKKMKLIKNHKENFNESLAKDEGQGILGLMIETKQNSNTLENKIKQIKESKENLAKNKQLLKEDETQTISEKMHKLKLELETLSIEKVKHSKRIEVIKENSTKILGSIKQETETLGCKVI